MSEVDVDQNAPGDRIELVESGSLPKLAEGINARLALGWRTFLSMQGSYSGWVAVIRFSRVQVGPPPKVREIAVVTMEALEQLRKSLFALACLKDQEPIMIDARLALETVEANINDLIGLAARDR